MSVDVYDTNNFADFCNRNNFTKAEGIDALENMNWRECCKTIREEIVAMNEELFELREMKQKIISDKMLSVVCKKRGIL